MKTLKIVSSGVCDVVAAFGGLAMMFAAFVFLCIAMAYLAYAVFVGVVWVSM